MNRSLRISFFSWILYFLVLFIFRLSFHSKVTVTQLSKNCSQFDYSLSSEPLFDKNNVGIRSNICPLDWVVYWIMSCASMAVAVAVQDDVWPPLATAFVQQFYGILIQALLLKFCSCSGNNLLVSTNTQLVRLFSMIFIFHEMTLIRLTKPNWILWNGI